MDNDILKACWLTSIAQNVFFRLVHEPEGRTIEVHDPVIRWYGRCLMDDERLLAAQAKGQLVQFVVESMTESVKHMRTQQARQQGPVTYKAIRIGDRVKCSEQLCIVDVVNNSMVTLTAPNGVRIKTTYDQLEWAP